MRHCAERLGLVLFVACLAIQSAWAGGAPLAEIEKRGNGDRTLLLIPCMSCRWKSWETFMERNRDRYTMYAVTLPGFGGSPRPELPLNTEGTPWRDNALQRLSQLIDREDLRQVVVIGHSWGSMVAVQLAALRPDRIEKMINLDGSLVMPVKNSRMERLSQAAEIVESQSRKLADPEQWRVFNGGGRDTLKPPAAQPTMERHRALLYHGMFMATDRNSLLQYWRENVLIDLRKAHRGLTAPILDLQAMQGGDYGEKRRRHLSGLKALGARSNIITTIFLHDTSHFVMEHRPELLDRIVDDFLQGRSLVDFKPDE